MTVTSQDLNFNEGFNFHILLTIFMVIKIIDQVNLVCRLLNLLE